MPCACPKSTLKKVEAENGARDKKIFNLEKQVQHIQGKIQVEVEARTLAENERREADAEANLLKKGNKQHEDNIATASKVTQKAERQAQQLTEKAASLQTQNSYLTARVDAAEEEKNGLKAELHGASDRLGDLNKQNAATRDDIRAARERLKTLKSDKSQLQGELDFIKREDVLDESGRQRPLLIQAAESTLLERLGVNEFLYDAQQQRNPVPAMVEKLAQLLELLHTGQSQADQYLADLSKSNSLVSALRQKNMVLFEKAQMFESFKTRALIRYVNCAGCGLLLRIFLVSDFWGRFGSAGRGDARKKRSD